LTNAGTIGILKVRICTMKVDILETGRDARLLRDYTVETSIRDITIPAGFVTDFASVPQLFWSIIPPMGKYFVAAVLHDYFYREPASRICADPEGLPITRELADRIFLEEMADLKVSWWKRRLMYRAVRVGGSSSWVEQPLVLKEDKDNE
jgi:hypothetical protein